MENQPMNNQQPNAPMGQQTPPAMGNNQQQPPMGPPQNGQGPQGQRPKKPFPFVEVVLMGLPLLMGLFILVYGLISKSCTSDMACYSARISIATICGLMFVTALLIFCFRNWQARIALCIQLLLEAGMPFLMIFIGFCKDAAMDCVKVLRPSMMVFSIIIAVATIVELIMVLVTNDRRR